MILDLWNEILFRILLIDTYEKEKLVELYKSGGFIWIKINNFREF